MEREAKSTVIVRVRVSPEVENPSRATPCLLSLSRIPAAPAAVARSGQAVNREESGDGEAVREIAPAMWWWQDDLRRMRYICRNCCCLRKISTADCEAVNSGREEPQINASQTPADIP
jgi:hypothetical protein